MSDPYFTVDELRATDTALANASKYPDDKLTEMGALVEQALEDVMWVAFVPREYTETFSGQGTHRLFTRWSRLRAVTSATQDAVDLDPAEVQVIRRCLYRADAWTEGVANIEVTYQHGYDAPPLRLKRAALTLAKNWLLKGPIDDRATAIRDDGGGLITLATPGVRGASFGIPEVDAVVDDLGEPPSPTATHGTASGPQMGME